VRDKVLDPGARSDCQAFDNCFSQRRIIAAIVDRMQLLEQARTVAPCTDIRCGIPDHEISRLHFQVLDRQAFGIFIQHYRQAWIASVIVRDDCQAVCHHLDVIAR